MFEIYSNNTGESLYIANSRYGLNQCMGALKAQGIETSYGVVKPEFDYPERLASIPRWTEQ